MSRLELVTPVEYQKNRIVRYYGYRLSSLDEDSIKGLFDELSVKAIPEIWEESGGIFYRYPGKPLIIIKDGQFFTTKETWNGREFSHREIMHQASILLRILHKFGLASYNRKAIPKSRFTPHKWRDK